MRRYRALVEDDAAIGIDAGGDIGGGHLAGLGAQLLRILRQRQRVQIDDAEDAVIVALHRNPVADRAQIIAEVQIAGGLDAREDAVHETAVRVGSGARERVFIEERVYGVKQLRSSPE